MAKKNNNKKNANRIDSIEKQKALEAIQESARDFLSAKITIPLGNPALKKVHTNQFLFTELPKEFPLVNWEKISKAYAGTVNRYSGYMLNRWYVEGVTVDVDAGGKAEMKLDLNAFATSQSEYINAYKGYVKALSDSTSQSSTSTSSSDKNKEAGSSTSSGKGKSNAVSSGSNKAIKNGWWGKWVTDMVRKQVGDETNVLKNCKTMHEFFRWKTRWTRYSDMVYTGGSVYRLEKAWHRHKFNCGDGANYLSAFYSCCGAKTGIYLTYDREHYIVKVVIDGKTYWCDHSGGEGKYNTLRGWNHTWHGYRSGSYRGRYV